MKTKYIISALLAMAGLTIGANASTVSSAIPDLLLGFQQSGTSTDYEADLGSMSNYVGLAPNTTLNLSGDISAADLSSIFSSSWNTSSNVTWAAAATVGSTSATLNGVPESAKTTWITQFDSIQTGLSPAGTAPASQFHDTSGTTLNNRVTGISNLYTGLNGATALSTPDAAAVSTASGFSYSHWMGSQVVNTFGANFDAPTALNLTPGQFSVVDLFQYVSGTTSTSGTYVGSLELGADGSLFFTNFVPTSVPEPATYAAFAGIAVLGFVMLRRRSIMFA